MFKTYLQNRFCKYLENHFICRASLNVCWWEEKTTQINWLDTLYHRIFALYAKSFAFSRFGTEVGWRLCEKNVTNLGGNCYPKLSINKMGLYARKLDDLLDAWSRKLVLLSTKCVSDLRKARDCISLVTKNLSVVRAKCRVQFCTIFWSPASYHSLHGTFMLNFMRYVEHEIVTFSTSFMQVQSVVTDG